MKKALIIVLPCVFCILIVSCETQEELQFLQSIVRPQASERIALYSSVAENEQFLVVNEQVSPLITLPDNYIIHQIYELSVDDDPPSEQIIAHKFRDNQDAAIILSIIDYDLERDSYFLSWQSETSTTNIRSLNIYTDDVTDDGRLEIIVHGTNDTGNQTLDIYRLNSNVNLGIQYNSILSIQADIAVEISAIDRDVFTANPNSSYVQSLNQNLESDNPLDMIQSTYSWNDAEERYLLTLSQNISGVEIEQDQLAELYAGEISGFYNFVDGLWQQNNSGQIISFSRRNNSIQLATSDRQLHFHWISSSRWGIAGNFWATIQNEIRANDTQRIQISIRDLNTIYVHLSGETTNTFWSGTYNRISGQFLSTSTPEQSNDIQLYPFDISGLYLSNDDREIFFSAPNFTLRSQDEERRGGFVIYQLNEVQILQMIFVNEFNAYVETEAYILNFEEINIDNQIQRRIYLQNAELTSIGAQLLSDSIIQFEQIIQLDEG